ncbi:MAG: hypothetical protein IKR76_07575 [Ruminococcus sp.]|nr:hypothetical protein [Ruminococcus sp.]
MIIKRLISVALAAAVALGAGAAVTGFTLPVIEVQAQETEESTHVELLAKCRGNYAYNDLGTRTNGAKMQQFYEKLYDVYTAVWESDEDYTEYDGSSELFVVSKVNYKTLGLTDDEAISTYYAMRYDNPAMYYLINQYATNSTYYFALINEEYTKASVRKEMQQAIYDYVTDMTAATAGYTRRYERALILHDKILPMMTYNYDDMRAVYSHNVIGAVYNRTGVCESYAKAYQMLLNYVGIDNFLVIGTDLYSGGGHAWNAVKMDNGTYYYVDPTWDDKRDTHKYFAKGSTVFDADHAVRENASGAGYYYTMPANIPTGDYSCQANNPTLYNQMSQFSFYINEDNTVTLVSYLQNAQKVNLPTEILGFTVKALGIDALFNKTALTELVIPEGITTIASGATFNTLFSSSAKKITIPKSVTSIGDCAFGYIAGQSASGYQYTGDYSIFAPKKISGFTIYCYKNSAGCKYAVDNGFDYVLLDADEVEIIPGDANGDGEVTVMDVLLIRQSLAGWSIEINELAADVDANGVVNVLDVLLIRQSLAGWNVVLRTRA